MKLSVHEIVYLCNFLLINRIGKLKVTPCLSKNYNLYLSTMKKALNLKIQDFFITP